MIPVRRTLAPVVLTVALAALPAFALSPVNKSLFGGVAIEGYDTVAYFTDSKPVEGKKEFQTTWNGATWRFVSAEHRDLFVKEPAKYAPQYGGYCAWAVAQNDTAGIDPKAWTIVDGRLYLNYSLDIQKKWSADVPGNIKKGDTNWPHLLGH
ncbi:MAG TPA: YHS domain-containing (seleno)protein [Candidatus Polarisedimenticolaceae bacterium]|nr:YHS domain-containing (seleno)protein [Candidatus Polarisedimenticolaceae bacterium]